MAQLKTGPRLFFLSPRTPRHGDFMYVFGGYDGSAWLNDMFDFDFERGACLG